MLYYKNTIRDKREVKQLKNNLIEFRKDKKMTRSEIAKEVGVSLSLYEKIELGARNPSYNFICKFIRAFNNVDVNKIFFEKK